MIEFKELPFYKQVTRVYILSIAISLFFAFLFNKFYIFIFRPSVFGSMFFPIPDFISSIITGFFFGIFLFLPFFIFWLLKRKKWKVWGAGIAIPALMIIDAGIKHILWALILTVIGWLLAQGILLIRKKIQF